MCRSIKTLRRANVPATDEEIRAAALQYVRKVTGFRAPTARHAAAFDAAVEEIARASSRVVHRIAADLPQRA